MPASLFSCPHCQAPLRAKDASLAGRTVECPDCHRALKFTVDASRQLAVQPATAGASTATVPVKGGVAAIADTAKAIRHRAVTWRETLGNPLVVAWGVACLLTIMFVIALWPRRNETAKAPAANRDVAMVEAKRESIASGSKSPLLDDPPVAAPKPAAAMVVNHPAAPVASEAPAVAQKPNPAKAATVEPPPPGALVDVAANLAQPILRFDQKTAATFRELLLSLEEMAGVPIMYDRIDATRMQAALDTRVSLSLERTTVGQILEQTLKRVGMSYAIEDGVIRLLLIEEDQPAQAGRPPRQPQE